MIPALPMSGRVCVVTGASTGIGKAASVALARPESAARTLVYLASAPEVSRQTGAPAVTLARLTGLGA